MTLITAARLAAFCAIVHAAPIGGPGGDGIINWGNCTNNYNSSLPVDCGRLTVALDYSKGSRETLSLSLFRVPAKVQPARGNILLNFGGPGIPGQYETAILAELMQNLTGGVYNLINIEPRGTGNTLPFTCYDTEAEYQKFLDDTSVVPYAYEQAAMGRLWARASIDAAACARKQSKNGALISTAFTARDFKSVAEALGEADKIKYWGFSYGTTLGATLVSMFPDDMERVILDGVQNPHEYYHAYADVEEWTQSDLVFSHIFKHCVRNPDNCPLARNNATAAQLERSTYQLLDRLERRPVVIGNVIVDNNLISGLFALAIKSPDLWPRTVAVIDMLQSGNISDGLVVEATLRAGIDPKKAMAEPQSLLGIHCLDRSARAKTLDEFLPTAETLFRTSRIMGGADMYVSMACAQWKLEPRERYGGDFRVRSKNPVLLIGNTYDSHTPIASARNVSRGFEGSVVLEVNGYGHTSIGLKSRCNYNAISNYWLNGTLPEPGTVCQVDVQPFATAPKAV